MQNQIDKMQRAALDHRRRVRGIYGEFLFPPCRPLLRKQANQITALAGSHSITKDRSQEIREFVDSGGTVFAVTMSIQRAQYRD